MNSRSASRLLFSLFPVLLFLSSDKIASAQTLPAQPPAFGVAQRLQGEAQQAAAYAQVLKQTNNMPQAAYELDIAHRRAYQAVIKYQQVVTSRTYGPGTYGAESLFQEAQVQENYLHDINSAVLSLQNLQNKYKGVNYPSEAKTASTIASYESMADQHNKTTSPGSNLYAIINFFVNLFGGSRFSYSYALAILAISVIVRLALTPLSIKQFSSMREMQKLQPYVQGIQAKYKNDREQASRKIMELYRKNGANPAAGCLPMLVQLPILYLLYYMIRLYQFQFVHGKFLWVGSNLSAKFPAIIAPNLGQQDIPLLVLYALSMYVTQKLTITPSPDPQQAEQQRMMTLMTPFLSTYFFLQWHLPSAFVLYYLTFNILSTVQQKFYMQRRHADIHGEPVVDIESDAGNNTILLDSTNSKTGTRGVSANSNVANKNGANKNGTKVNGTAPTAKGIIAPQKIHPKKKRR